MDGTDSSAIFGNLLGGATSIATGNPLGAASAVAGLGLSIFGGMGKADAAAQQAQISRQMAETEQRQDTVRQRAMELSARRQQMEVLRNAQRARALGLQNATTQGAQFGSGLQGGYGQVSGGAGWNIQGINQNLGFGQQMFGLNAQLNQQKMQMTLAGSSAATAQGWSSLGGSLMQASGPLGRLGKQFGPSPSDTGGGSFDTIGGSTSRLAGLGQTY